MEENKIFIISAAIVVLSLIAAVGYYNINQTNSMARNLDNIAGKGIDPLSVRCAYANSTDTICIAYAAASKK